MLLDAAIGVWGGVNHEGCGGEEGRGAIKIRSAASLSDYGHGAALVVRRGGGERSSTGKWISLKSCLIHKS